MCAHLHTLPAPGGLFDQDCFLVLAMSVVYQVQQQIEQASIEKSKKDADSKGRMRRGKR